MEQLDIVERLRGKVRVPVNDGAGLLNGLDYFERTFPTSKAAMEAAGEIERLRGIEKLYEHAKNCMRSYEEELQTAHSQLVLAHEALRGIDQIVRTPTKVTRHRTAQDHFQSDFDAIRKIIMTALAETDD